MKRYFGFGGDHYYPNGGMNDFIGFFDTVDDAQIGIENYLKENCLSSSYWGHVWDSETKKIIRLNLNI